MAPELLPTRHEVLMALKGCGCGLHPEGVGVPESCSEDPVLGGNAGELQPLGVTGTRDRIPPTWPFLPSDLVPYRVPPTACAVCSPPSDLAERGCRKPHPSRGPKLLNYTRTHSGERPSECQQCGAPLRPEGPPQGTPEDAHRGEALPVPGVRASLQPEGPPQGTPEDAHGRSRTCAGSVGAALARSLTSTDTGEPSLAIPSHPRGCFPDLSSPHECEDGKKH